MQNQSTIEFIDKTPDNGSANTQLLNLQLLEANKQITHALDKINNIDDVVSLKNLQTKIDNIRIRNIK